MNSTGSDVKPLVSIIMASYNKAAFIAETISSVLAQRYSQWELIIVDDCSTDNSLSVISGFSDGRIHLIANTANSGANRCRNTGIRHAKGDYLMFLDADDLLEPFCLEQRIRTAAKKPGVDLLVFSMGVFYKTIGDDKRQWQPVAKQALRGFLMHDLPWSIMQPLWRTEFIRQISGFNESYQRLQDVELHTRALLQPGVQFRQFPGKPDCHYRIDESRQNYACYEFLHRWLSASIHYCEDFFGKLGSSKKYLKGTLFAIYRQIGFQTKTRSISKQESEQLLGMIFRSDYWKQLSAWDKFIWKAAYFNNFRVRIPGINFILSRLLTAG